MGFSAVQVSEAINMVNSLEVETLLSELTKETTCKSKEYNELTKYLIVKETIQVEAEVEFYLHLDSDLDSAEDKQKRENQHRYDVNQLPDMGSMFSEILEAITSTNSLQAEPPFKHLMLGQYL